MIAGMSARFISRSRIVLWPSVQALMMRALERWVG